MAQSSEQALVTSEVVDSILIHQSSGKYHKTIIKPLTHTQYCWRRVDGEKCFDSYIKNIGQNPSPTDSLFQDYDYDIGKL